MMRLAALLRAVADPRPDRELLAAFVSSHDEAAFAEIMRRHGPMVWGVCRRGLPEPADAEDAFQTTFLVLVRQAQRLADRADLGAWLYKVALWTARSLRRKNARRLARRRELPDVPARLPEATGVEDLLLALPENVRAALVLCRLQGLTHREAAARLGCAEGTVSARVSRGLARLRAKLGAGELAALAAATVPASLASLTVQAAVADRLGILAAVASPAVLQLLSGVQTMFAMKKLLVSGSLAALTVAIGFGLVLGGESPALNPIAAPVPKGALPAVAENKGFVEVRVATSKGHLSFAVEEFAADGKSLGMLLSPDGAGLTLFLSHVARDEKAPKQVKLVVKDGSTLPDVLAAAEAAHAGGFTKISYYGSLPPGCGAPAGGTPANAAGRFDGANWDLAELVKALQANWMKC